jgi:ammonium transporter Rh
MTDGDKPAAEGEWTATTFSLTAYVFQAIIIVLFGATGVKYDVGPVMTTAQDYTQMNAAPKSQDVSVMIYVGFGFLMCFLARYHLASVSFNFVVAALSMQWSLLVAGFMEHAIGNEGKHYPPLIVNVKKITDATFYAASVLIAFGALLGKTTPVQLLWLAVILIVGLAINFQIIVIRLGIVDVGGSYALHLFGAIVGVTTSWMFGKMNANASPAAIKAAKPDASANRVTDTIAMVGTLFLYIMWPSFNGGLVEGSQYNRAFINTHLALAACCVTAFATSGLLRPKRRFSMVDIQNATLAGGVAIGAAADLIVEPWGALLAGIAAGFISVAGFAKAQAWLEETFSIHDSCGVMWLHGVPGILGAIISAISVAWNADADTYGATLYTIFFKMASSNATESAAQGVANPGEDREKMRQGGIQMAALCITIGIAVVTGLVIGAFIGSPLFRQLETRHFFDDSIFFTEEEPEEEEHKDQEMPAVDVVPKKVDVQSANPLASAVAPSAAAADADDTAIEFSDE